MMHSNAVSGEAFIDPAPSVVWQRRSISVQYLLQRFRR